MKQVVFSIFCILVVSSAFAQFSPAKHDTVAINKLGIKTISTKMTTTLPNWDYSVDLEINRVEFNEKGQIIYEKEYGLFDIMTESFELTYTYNELDQIDTKLIIYMKYPNDDMSNGVETMKEHFVYKYVGGLLKEERRVVEYSNERKEEYLITYEYDGVGNKVKASYSDVNNPKLIGRSNRVEYFSYNADNLLTKKWMKWNIASVQSMEMNWYNSENQKKVRLYLLDAEKNGSLYFYSYNADGQLIEQVMVNDLKLLDKWFDKRIYEYDGGCKTKFIYKRQVGSPNIKTYECDENGLLKFEYWHASDQDKIDFTFETKYSFF